MFEEGLLARLLFLLASGKVPVLAGLVQCLGVNALEVHLLAGRDHIARIHPPQRHAIDLERSCDQQDTLRQVLEQHHALAPESAREQDEHRAGLQRLADFGRADSLACLL